MSIYSDLSVIPESADDLKSIVTTAKMMRLKILGVPWSLVREPTCSEGVLLLPRHAVKASTRREARKGLDNAPKEALVVVEALETDAARYAAVNKRVDVLRIPPDKPGLVDRSTARLFRERGWGLVELSLSEVKRNLEALRPLAIAARRAVAYSIPFTVVSDARDYMDLWHPRAAAALLEVVGVPWKEALSALTTYPLSSIMRRSSFKKVLRSCLAPRTGATS
ncbi:MAG: hypothetical protein LRS46_00975 [Desulfurococcales archaeon]|nr:hypothetical protein [Desulfurococcales archaeon]